MGDSDNVTPVAPDVFLHAPASDGVDPLALFGSEPALEPAAAASAQQPPSAASAQQPPSAAAPAASAVTPVAALPAMPLPAGRAAAGGHVAPGEAKPLPLDEVIGRLGSVAWVEGVAIVEALSAALADGDGADARVPELSQIAIEASGRVVVSGSGTKGPPGPPLARILHALTATGVVAVPVRLFITKWTSYPEEHSVRDFCTELAYFARPDGAALIAAVYERALSAGVAPAKPHTPSPKAKPAEQQKPQRRRRAGRRVMAAVVIVAGGALGAVWVWGDMVPSSGPSSTFSVEALMADTADLARQVAAAVSERVGLAPPAPPDSEASDTRAAATTPVRARGTARARPAAAGGVSAAAGPISDSVLRDRPLLEAREATPPEAVVAPSLAMPALVEGAGGTTASVAPPATIYSSEDSDVEPPELRHPQLPPPFLSGAGADVNTVELIISAAGRVERVRLVTPPKRMSDMMLLSGAKAWTFAPASLEGRSVRYRMMLSWSATR